MIVPLSVDTKKRKVAVITPREWFLIREKLNKKYQIRGDYLLNTAMRISEATYVGNHPKCFREENGAIFLPKVDGMGKEKCTIKNRQIMLSEYGITSVKTFFVEKVGLLPYQNLEAVFKRAARDADFDTKYITTKMLRKTMISWLMAIYPDRQEQIAFSAGHDFNTMRLHYLTYGWGKENLKDMRDYVKGWGEQ